MTGQKNEPKSSPLPRKNGAANRFSLKQYKRRSAQHLQEISDADQGSLDRLRMSGRSPGIRGS